MIHNDSVLDCFTVLTIDTVLGSFIEASSELSLLRPLYKCKTSILGPRLMGNILNNSPILTEKIKVHLITYSYRTLSSRSRMATRLNNSNYVN